MLKHNEVTLISENEQEYINNGSYLKNYKKEG